MPVVSLTFPLGCLLLTISPDIPEKEHPTSPLPTSKRHPCKSSHFNKEHPFSRYLHQESASFPLCPSLTTQPTVGTANLLHRQPRPTLVSSCPGCDQVPGHITSSRDHCCSLLTIPCWCLYPQSPLFLRKLKASFTKANQIMCLPCHIPPGTFLCPQIKPTRPTLILKTTVLTHTVPPFCNVLSRTNFFKICP